MVNFTPNTKWYYISSRPDEMSKSGASFIKCCAETILKLILQSSLKYAYVRFIKWTYEQKTHVRDSFRCEIYESWMILNSHATEWFQLSAL